MRIFVQNRTSFCPFSRFFSRDHGFVGVWYTLGTGVPSMLNAAFTGFSSAGRDKGNNAEDCDINIIPPQVRFSKDL